MNMRAIALKVWSLLTGEAQLLITKTSTGWVCKRITHRFREDLGQHEFVMDDHVKRFSDYIPDHQAWRRAKVYYELLLLKLIK